MLLDKMFNFLPKSIRSASYGKTTGLYPFYTSSNVVDKYVDEYDYEGEFLIIGDGGSGNCKYINGKFSASDHNFILKPINNCNILCVKYFLMKDNYKILNSGFKGVGIKNVTKTYIKNIDYRYNLTFSEDIIVYSLSNIEKLINKEYNKLKKLNELIKSRFIEQFLENQTYRKDKWDNVLYIFNGKDYKGHEGYKYPIYGSGGFMGIYANDFLASGTITLIGRKGTIDKPLLVNGNIWNIDTVFAIKTNEKILNPIYFYYRSKFYDYQKLNRQTTKPSLRKSDLLNLEIEMPPLEDQLKFVKFVELIDKLKFNIQKRIDLYQELLDKKMDEYFG